MTLPKRGRQVSRPGGFTLLELIVVITIIGILGTIVTVKVIPLIFKAKATVAESGVMRIVEAAKLIGVLKGRLPDTLEEMGGRSGRTGESDRRARGGARRSRDHRYAYCIEGGLPVAVSYGRDGIEGGEGEDADIRWPRPRS